ncbi:MAG TPA: hypothetical protein DCX25_00155 [Candidatus Pacebacteria bacterium]|nr:MAG: hypothetical protein UX00_C0003G0017 [Microgenomates group bacterium GW2011_GWB1_45_17]KKU24177.1 MAG: hypothetical protein UX36_C0002G0160 [Microgenomates group bacterium GW2011_GWC1_46_15]KKU24892.1 MAG: hypothetical protein UX35_C0001G0074 [Microgenomates group bacterium GW2011_GWA1_46_15]HAV14733.1 hypothetical protein [Candidatus Paceibacterota bacterium]HCR92708.1 hypothetical protein [Candidatus Paceibacterota bacterium]
MGLGDDVTQIASDVGGALSGVAVDTAKAVAKTPLDILEEILGGKPPLDTAQGGEKNEAQKNAEKAMTAADDPAQKALIQQKLQEDQAATTAKLKRHRELMADEQQFYAQGKAQEEQEKKVEKQQEKEQEKFEIKQLEKQKHENLQVKMAQDAANAEKSRNLGAG